MRPDRANNKKPSPNRVGKGDNPQFCSESSAKMGAIPGGFVRASKSVRSLWLLAAIAPLVGLLAMVWYSRQPEQLARRYQDELATVPDDEVETPLRRFAELGDAGLKALAAALASERGAVRQAAHRVLLEEVDRWELLSGDAVTSRLESLARALAESAPRMDNEKSPHKADQALRLLLWPRDAESPPSPWLADCESVLATAAEHGRPSNPVASAMVAAKGSSDPNSMQPIAGSPGGLNLGLTLADKVQLPGGDLPLEMAPMPDGGGFVEPRIAQNVPELSREPRRLQAPSNARSLEDDNGDDDDDGNPPGGANHPGRLPSTGGGSRQKALGLQAGRQTLGSPKANDAAAWQRLEPRDVMRRLHVSDPQVVVAAREELERRGISGPLVDLARRATDPDPNVRQKLAEALPSLPGINAKPWLLELSYDDNSQVRATAVTLLATSGDLELVRRLEQISRDDPDDHIRAQAAKVLEPRQR